MNTGAEPVQLSVRFYRDSHKSSVDVVDLVGKTIKRMEIKYKINILFENSVLQLEKNTNVVSLSIKGRRKAYIQEM